jgi:hypothetical protein
MEQNRKRCNRAGTVSYTEMLDVRKAGVTGMSSFGPRPGMPRHGPLARVLFTFYDAPMERIDPQQLSELILAAPAWARVGITMPDERMRKRAAQELAATIVEQLGLEDGEGDEGQLRLPMLPEWGLRPRKEPFRSRPLADLQRMTHSSSDALASLPLLLARGLRGKPVLYCFR